MRDGGDNKHVLPSIFIWHIDFLNNIILVQYRSDGRDVPTS